MTPIPRVIFVLGGPGSGKGTYCGKMVDAMGFYHISAGDCLREEAASGSEYGELINGHIQAGSIVPVEITVRLMLKKIRARAEECEDRQTILIDGFPRNQENLDGWNSIVDNECEVVFCLYLECMEKVMTDRLLNRGKTSGRSDDNIETINKRFHTFRDSTLPIVEYYSKHGKLVTHNTDGEIASLWPQFQTRVTQALCTK
ncbi:MAG: uncharacterized protein KVP18_001564 [Porospora cf. gigantea A]|uniref:uncharacterized protein n=1 Tax=Porospora cf. gigantea A TaxID=2853593 RepID=UPI00355A112F|nr:MAG: hypothetical protein KVP18_001564 [Porospora cf. gigantea A]